MFEILFDKLNETFAKLDKEIERVLNNQRIFEERLNKLEDKMKEKESK